MRTLLIAGSTTVLLAVTGCKASSDDAAPASAAPTGSPTTPDSADSETAPPTISPTSSEPATQDTSWATIPPTATPAASTAPTSGAPDLDPASTAAAGTIVRFTSGDASIDVTITEDSATTRDFLSMLPLTLTVEEFNGREKISYLPRELDTAGSPGSDPEDGDLIYFVPWGNLGFYYNTDGIGFSDQVIHLGTYDATLEQLTGLEGSSVSVEIVE